MAKKTCGCGMSGLSGTARRKLVKDVEVDGEGTAAAGAGGVVRHARILPDR